MGHGVKKAFKVKKQSPISKPLLFLSSSRDIFEDHPLDNTA